MWNQAVLVDELGNVLVLLRKKDIYLGTELPILCSYWTLQLKETKDIRSFEGQLFSYN